MYQQNYNPLGSVLLSTIVAAIPILTLLYFIALHPHRDQQGVRHLGAAISEAGRASRPRAGATSRRDHRSTTRRSHAKA